MIKYHQCLVKKAQGRKGIGPLHSLDIPNNKWENIIIDFIIRLPCTKKSHEVI